jgi:hypothetical protein
MRPLLVVLATGLGLVAFASAAGGVPDQNLVAGTGQRLNLAGNSIQVHVNAQRGPAGADARGQYWVIREVAGLGTFVHRGRVTCLTVAGNRAAARGPVEESNDPAFPVGSDFQVQVTDNGSPGKLTDTNINIFPPFPPGGETGCPIFPVGEVPITQGNFVVHDATG